MRQRKLPLFIHVNPAQPVSLNKTCKYCPDCDLLMAHRDEIEKHLNDLVAQLHPGEAALGHEDYLIIGTLERAAWKQNIENYLTIEEILGNLHDFKEVTSFKLMGGWGKW
jgi:hypothetical protein